MLEETAQHPLGCGTVDGAQGGHDGTLDFCVLFHAHAGESRDESLITHAACCARGLKPDFLRLALHLFANVGQPGCVRVLAHGVKGGRAEGFTGAVIGFQDELAHLLRGKGGDGFNDTSAHLK